MIIDPPLMMLGVMMGVLCVLAVNIAALHRQVTNSECEPIVPEKPKHWLDELIDGEAQRINEQRAE